MPQQTTPHPTTHAPTLSIAQARGLLRLGDVVVPGDDVLPSFSRAVAAADADRMLPYLSDADRSSLLLLLDVCGRLPKPAVRALVAAAAGWRRAPEPVAAGLRMAHIGIKGVVHSLYWSDLHRLGIHEVIGYDARVDEAAYERSLATTEPTEEEQ